ncbi:AMP-binding protein [Antarctobacter sp.]|uniref:AMP-binding protein n=1 Tax=Antarctobacter sp. TaxID=1872577 RepID=UPI003A8EF26B
MKGRAIFGAPEAAAWRPSARELDRSRLAAAMRRWGHNSLAGLHRHSIDEAEDFWRKAVADLGIEFSQPWTAFKDDSAGHALPRWFVDGRLNAASNCVTRHAQSADAKDRAAVIYEGDSGARREMSYGELGSEVERIAAGLKGLGVGKGDRVALFAPVIPEVAVVFMACAKIGAVFVPAFSGYGPEPLAARLNAAEVAVIVTVDGTTRKGNRVPMKDVVDAATALSPSVRHVVTIRHDGSETAHQTRDIDWAELGKGLGPVPTEACDANDPVMIVYTSGTTGAPKGIVHSHAGFLAKAGLDFGYCFDVQADDRIGWIADMGWFLGPLMLFGCLQFGATIVFVEGLPNHPDENRMWEIVARNRVTVLGMAPTAARGLRAAMDGAAPDYDLSSLRAFAATGEAWDVPTWTWMFETVGQSRLPILNYCGGTETGGGLITNYTITPMSPASFAGPILGHDMDIVDADGNPTDGIGEIIVRNTWPGMTHAFWRDTKRYLGTYWDRWPGIWLHGDLASIDSDGFWHIHGRSDDTIKVAGRRIGPAEIESALVTDPQISEAAVIGVPDPDKGSRIVAFVTTKGDAAGFDRSQSAASVSRLVGKAMVPSEILRVEALPKTKNGKILRRAIRARYLGEPAGDMSSLDAATPLEAIPVRA